MIVSLKTDRRLFITGWLAMPPNPHRRWGPKNYLRDFSIYWSDGDCSRRWSQYRSMWTCRRQAATDQCVVCYNECQLVKLSGCSHSFCSNCIAKVQPHRCPLCRAPFHYTPQVTQVEYAVYNLGVYLCCMAMCVPWVVVLYTVESVVSCCRRREPDWTIHAHSN